MLFVAGGYVVFAVMSGFAPDPTSLIVLRTLLGFTIGLSITVVPVFIAESSPNAIRGGLLASYQVATVIGIVFGYVIGWRLSYMESWRWMLGVAAIPAAIVFLALLRVPETPQWLMMTGKERQAKRVLTQITRSEEYESELTALRTSLEESKDNNSIEYLKDMFSGYLACATIFIIALGFFIQITGINATIYYAPKIFEQMGFEGNAQQLLLPAVVQVFSLIAVIISMMVIDSYGRRKVLLSGIGVMIAANALLIVVYSLGGGEINGLEILGFIGIVLFTMGYTGGFGAIVWVFAGELFPMRYRATGSSVLLTADLVANAIVAQLFPPLLESIGGTGVFAVFGVLALIAFAVVFRWAPETKERRLEDIQKYWENGARWESQTASPVAPST